MTSYYNTNIRIERDEEEDRASRLKLDRWIFGLLLLVIAFIPLLVGGYVKEVTSPHIIDIDVLTSGTKGDLFTHYKAIALMVITVIAVVLLCMKVFFINGQIRKTKLNLFLGIFAIMLVLSTILSPSISIALWGQYNRSDGAISYICYLALLFVAMNISYPKKAIQYVMYALYPFISINLVLITMNFYGHDAMAYPAVEKMMSLFLSEGVSLGGGAILLGTLNQWNFMSGMFAVMTAMYLAWAIIDKSVVNSCIGIGGAVISLAIMLMSLSTSGFVAILLIAPLLIVLAVKSAHRKKAAIGLIAFAIVSLPVFHILAEKNPRIWDESIGFIINQNPYKKEQPAAMIPSNFNISLENKAYAAENNFELPVLPASGVSAGTGRFYIWEKTVDLTMKRPLFGYGMDTLMYHFPHYNIDARAGLKTEETIVDKPHSMYVGAFYGTGIVGFIGFMGVLILTGWLALQTIFTRKYVMASVFGIGWLAFLIQALFNDTLPGTAGPMWAIAGMMMALVLINNEVEKSTDELND